MGSTIKELEEGMCVICFKTSRRKNSVLKVTGLSSLDKFVHALFVLKRVLKVKDGCVEKLIREFQTEYVNGETDYSEHVGFCDQCAQSLEKLIEVHDELLETSQDIFIIKRKLFPEQNRKKRRFQVMCEEKELEPRKILKKENVDTRRTTRQQFKTPSVIDSASERSSTKYFYEGLAEDGEDNDNHDPWYSPDSPGANGFSDDSEPDSESPPKQNRGSSKTNKGDLEVEEPRVKRKYRRKTDPPSSRPKKSPSKKGSKVKMICPFCRAFNGVSTKVARFCEHLNTCRKDSDGTSSITCTHCKRFKTCDLVRFSEHFGICQGSKEKPLDVIPIKNRIFKCDACIHLSYFTFPDFLQHYIYHQRFTYRCTFVEKDGSLCTARRDAFSNMNVHLKTKHMKDTDEDAPANFVIDTTLPSMVWICHLCNSRFHSMDQRDAHLKSEHSSVTTSKCSICDHCPFASVIPEDIQIHMTTDHSQLVGYTDKFRRISYQCEICEEYHSTLKALNRHKWFTHKVGEGLVKLRHACPDCPKRFVVENQLISHQIREHARTDLGKDPLECDECHGKFKTINNLRSHIKTIHEKAGEKVCCEICGTAVASKQVLKKHLYRIHRIGSVEEIVCPDCGKSFDCQSNYKCHVATHHVKAALFNCEFCGKGYSKQRDLKNHLLLHKFPDLKVFSCELCPGKKFRTTDNLSVHWKKGHSPEEAQWLRNKGIREEEREEFLRVVGNDFTRVKLLFKTCSK